MSDGISKDEKNASSKKDSSEIIEKPVITYNFAHPQRVSKDQMRTLENLHSNLARMMASSFSTQQRSVVDCDIAFTDQTTYGEFIMSLSNPSCSYIFSIEPLGGPAIIDFSLPVAYSFIDRQFGGTGGNPPSEKRPLTSIERNIMRKVMSRILANLETMWEPLLKVRTSNTDFETNPEFMKVAATADTVILIALEVNSKHASGLVTMCYPYFTLEPIMAYLNVQTWASKLRGKRENSPEERLQRLQQLNETDLPIMAQLAKMEMPLHEITDLQIGDILKFDTHIDDPTVVFVSDRPTFLARPTRTGDKVGVQITQRIAKGQEAHHMNSVQKTETDTL